MPEVGTDYLASSRSLLHFYNFASHNGLCVFLIWVSVQPCYIDSEFKLESALCMSTTCNSLLFVQIDGIELMTELLQNEGWSHIPIIGKQVMP